MFYWGFDCLLFRAGVGKVARPHLWQGSGALVEGWRRGGRGGEEEYRKELKTEKGKKVRKESKEGTQGM